MLARTASVLLVVGAIVFASVYFSRSSSPEDLELATTPKSLKLTSVATNANSLASLGGDTSSNATTTTVKNTGSRQVESTASTTRPASSTSNPTIDPAATSAPAHVSTTKPPPTSSTSAAPVTAGASTSKVVVIDPGHQAKANCETEPIGPGSSTRKAKVSSGTAGVSTGIPESQLVLTIGLKLRDSLLAHGIRVVMTRTTQDVNLSNIERAQIANQAKADLFVRIHADGSDNPATRGIHVLYPASIKGWTDDIASESRRAALLAQEALVAATGAVDRGVDARSDLTGFNWSDVPVILAEIGFMTNPDEDRLLATEDYQDKIVGGFTKAILAFLGIN
ncbi:MAG: N-acetylmuramoyl-L-alanine amidase [Thermoleophilia bacterium]|nr:N-acetylmuramoyl-L-alanine amidase [Thermoleophilia bacterium]